jgi:hypothetical protein
VHDHRHLARSGLEQLLQSVAEVLEPPEHDGGGVGVALLVARGERR